MKKIQLVIGGIFLILILFAALSLARSRQKPPEKKTYKTKTKIAIVIDDWGYHSGSLEIIKKIKVPLTCAVLPNLKHSGFSAYELNKLGFEIILHLPMAPKENFRLENNTINSKMSAKQIRDILDEGLASVIYAKGISNHMGSKITEDKNISSIILAEAKNRNLYFLDSFVTAKSACKEISEKTGTRFAKRDIFLDHQDNPAYIKSQLIKLKKMAEKKHTIVAIGHDRKNTLTVLSEMLPAMQNEGYVFIFASQAAK